MRKATLVLNSFTVVFFICFLAYTFVARQHLDSLARDFVSEKTLEYSEPVVEIANESLDSPLVRQLLSNDQATAIRNEITAYQNDPGAYVADLTQQQVLYVAIVEANPLIAKVATIKNKVRTYYGDTLQALITDLRIFSISNLIAGLIAFVLAYRSSSEIRKPIVWLSFLMFTSVIYCSYLYIDGLTFFRILFRAHMGWWYAAFLCVMIIGPYLIYLRQANVTDQSDSQDDADSSGPSSTAR